MYVCMYICMYVSMYVSMYVCMCVDGDHEKAIQNIVNSKDSSKEAKEKEKKMLQRIRAFNMRMDANHRPIDSYMIQLGNDFIITHVRYFLFFL